MTSLPVSLRKEKPSKGTAPVLAPHPCSCWPSVRVSELDLAGLQGQTPPLCAATFSSCSLKDNSSEHAPTPALVILKFSLTTEYSHQQTKVALTASFSKTEIKQKKKKKICFDSTFPSSYHPISLLPFTAKRQEKLFTLMVPLSTASFFLEATLVKLSHSPLLK